MTAQEPYTVEVPAEAWRKLGQPSEALAAQVHAELERMATETAADTGGGVVLRTRVVDGDYSLLVAINHQLRTLALLEVERAG